LKTLCSVLALRSGPFHFLFGSAHGPGTPLKEYPKI
jgi:hypothetical protein